MGSWKIHTYLFNRNGKNNSAGRQKIYVSLTKQSTKTDLQEFFNPGIRNESNYICVVMSFQIDFMSKKKNNNNN